MKNLNFNVAGDPGDDRPEIVADNPPGGTILQSHFEGVPGQPPNRFVATVPATVTGGATLYFDHGHQRLRVIVPPGDGPWEAGLPPCQPPEDPTIAMIYRPPVPAMSPLVADGEFLRKSGSGEPFTIIQCSDFNLLNRSLLGEDVDSVMAQRAQIGFNYLRVWTAYSIDRIGRLVPKERPDLYDHIPDFLDKAARHGLYVELTAATGPWNGIFDTDSQKVQHWDRLRAAVSDKVNVSLELINEADNGPNRDWPINACARPTGLASHGSNSIDVDPVTPVWNIAGFHPGPDPRKVGHNAMERADMFKIPIWSGETVRYPDNDSSTVHAFDAAQAAALLCAGSCFHSVNGKLGLPFSGLELSCAQAWANGAKTVPLEFQRGLYRHRSDLEGGSVVRAYSRVISDGREFVVLIHE